MRVSKAMAGLWRVGWRLGVGLLVLVLALLVACLTGVDSRPYGETAYAARARVSLQSLASRPDLVTTNAFRAGFGRAKLTPTLGAMADDSERGEFRAVPLAGYGQREGRPATGVHDDVWVKAFAFAVGGQTGVVVAADALIIPREVAEMAAERIRSECGLSREQVYFGATHTHCSLGGWGEGMVAQAFAGGFQPGVRVWMARQLATAAAAAVRNLGDAAVGGGSFNAPEFIRNRLVGEQGRVDPEFALLVVRKEDGTTGVVGSYSAHATVLPGRFMEFSGDYPGYWQRRVEEQSRGMALFLAGGVGSHGPKPPENGLEGARRMGEALADRTLEAVRTIPLTNRIEGALATLAVTLPPLQARVSDGVRLRPWVARRLLPVGAETHLQVLRLADRVWLSTPCDYSGEMALDLKAAASSNGLHAAVTSFNGDYVGYVVPAKYYSMNTYETRTMSFFGPQLPQYFDALLGGLVSVVAPNSSAPKPGG